MSKISVLRRARLMTGLTLREVSEKTGIHYSLLSSYEVRRFPVRAHHQKILAQVFKMPESVLFGEE